MKQAETALPEQIGLALPMKAFLIPVDELLAGRLAEIAESA
jgi:hypothetical protein